MRTRGWLVVAVSVVPLSAGCGIYRINHLHSDANQKRMDKAAEAFAKVSSRRVGLDPILLKNLEASAALRRTVADARNRLHDGLTATAVTEKSWLTVRYDLLADLGVEAALTVRDPSCVLAAGNYESRRSKDPKLRPTPEEERCLGVITQSDDTKTAITETIERRIVRVQAISKVLGTLIAGQTALVTAAKEEIAGGAHPPKSPPATKTFPDLVVELARAVSQAGAKASAGTRSHTPAAREADPTRDEADALLRTILAAAERSRDPSSIYALAALVRTGLRKQDFALLDDLLLDLTTRLEPIVQGAQVVAAAGGAVPPAWKDFHERLTALGAIVPVGALHAQLRGARAERVTTVYRILENTAPRVALALPRSPAPKQGSLSKDELTQLRLDAAQVKGAMHRLGLLPTTLEAVTADLAMLTTGLRTAVGDLKTIVEAAKIDFTPGANAEATAVTFLTKTLGATPELTSRGALSASEQQELTQQLAALGAVVQDIAREQSAARERLIAFVKALRRLQLDLHEEALRHYEAVSAIATRDIKRWALLEHLDAQYSGVFYGTPNPSAPDLFLSQADLDAWHDRHGLQKPSCAARPGCHPPIDKRDLILPSVRRLAETAREWQRASPNRDDPRGHHAQISSLRLTSAVRTINAQMLMLSVNRAMADDNAIRLAAEVAEHDLHVDAIVARGVEAEITLAIGDLQAFHASGITTGDIQNVIGIVQSVLLAYIGGKI